MQTCVQVNTCKEQQEVIEKRMCRGSNAAAAAVAAADSVSADKHNTGGLYNGMQELFDEYAQRDTNFNSEKKWLF